jgi:hypothetical protein
MERRHWRFLLGGTLTAAVSIFFVYILDRKGGWDAFVGANLDQIGGLLSAWASSLAFIWLVVGYLQQGEELRHQIAETRRIAEETHRYARAIELNEQHARRDTFMRYAELVTNELLQISMFVIRATDTKEAVGTKHNYNQSSLREEFAAGNREVFFVGLIEAMVGGNRHWFKAIAKSTYGVDVTLRRYCYLFEGLLDEADKIGEPIRIFYELSNIGTLYLGIVKVFEWPHKLKHRIVGK